MTIGKISIQPTKHYLRDHSDVDWILVIKAILSPTKIHQNKRHGKNRWTYMRLMSLSSKFMWKEMLSMTLFGS